MSRKLEVVDLHIANEGWNNFFVYLSRGLLPVATYFYPFVDGSFELCNNWLRTSSDVEAGFNYPISKKIYLLMSSTTNSIFVCNLLVFASISLQKFSQ
jgi:hypothetical protein